MLFTRRSFIGFSLLFLILSQPVYAAQKHHMAYSAEIATLTIAMEARGEGPDGELAVAFVLLNRLKLAKWGSTLASVALAKKQFSCWNEGDPNRHTIAELKTDDPVILAARTALDRASSGVSDPTHGATHYYAVTLPEAPDWANSGTFLVQIGKQRFYKDIP